MPCELCRVLFFPEVLDIVVEASLPDVANHDTDDVTSHPWTMDK